MSLHFLRHASLAWRLGGGFGLLALMLLGIALFGALQLRALDTEVRDVLADEARASVLAAELEGRAHELAGALSLAVLTDSVSDVQAHLAHGEALRKASEGLRRDIETTLDTDDERTRYEAVKRADAAFTTAMAKVAGDIRSGDMDAARNALNSKPVRDARVALSGVLSAFAEAQRRALEASEARTAEGYRHGRNLLAAGALAALALAAVVSVVVARTVTGELGAEPREAAAVAQRIASGDLSQPVVLRPGDATSLMAAMQRMSESLAHIVGDVRLRAERVSEVTHRITSGNADLSQRTESQASALEQTAASMEQLGGTVKQNADNARRANALAQGASAVAVKGGDVVGQVVATMEGISESSARIRDIIGTIDGIAFQTNILALNAAVEAARAGEQGRGFAVVASEVRTLAQRSAAAAREIKELIGTSVERVGQGTVLVGEAGHTMQEIVGSIRHLTDIMGEISAASAEQSTGVQQVGEAVAQMDRATQQNASLVEASADAARGLEEHTGALVQAVSRFRLG